MEVDPDSDIRITKEAKNQPDRLFSKGKIGITHALIAIFIFLASNIVVFSYISYRNYSDHFREDLIESLGTISNLKSNELSQCIAERITDSNILFGRPSIYDAVKRLVQDPADIKSKEFLKELLGRHAEQHQYSGIYILDTRGAQIFAIPETATKLSSNVLERVPEILRAKAPELIDFYRNENDGQVYLSFTLPIIDESTNAPPIGVIIICVNPEKYIYPFIKNWPVHSDTAETLLIRRDGDDVLFLNELKFQKNTALNLRFKIDTNKDLPAAMAALGKVGIVEGIDYRGKDVVAYVRAVKETPWFMVSRLDKSEAYGPMRHQMFIIIWLAIATITTFGTIIWYVWWRHNMLFYKEQYLSAQALRNSEERYRRLFEAAKDGVLLIDFETGLITDVNPFLIGLLGYSKSELLKEYLWDVGSFKNIVASKANFQGLRDRGYVRYEDQPLNARDGKIIDVEFVSNVYLVGDKKIIQCNIRDITLRRKMERELYYAHKRQDAILGTVVDIIMEVNQDKVYVWSNKAGYEFFGDDVIGKEAKHYFISDQKTYDAVQSVFDGKESVVYLESWQRRKDGQEHLLAWWCKALKNANGEVTGALSSARDITEIRQLAKDLAQAKETQYRTLLENLPQKVFLKDRNSVYISCNLNYAKDLKIKPEEIAGMTDYELFPTYLAEKYREDDKRIMESGNTENIEEEFVAIKDFLRGGEKFIINTVKVPVRDKDGNITGLFGLFWDITDRKKAQENQDRLIALISKTPDFVGFADARIKNIIYINPAGRRMVGVGETEDISKLKIFDLHPEWVNKLFRDEILPEADRNGVWEGECAFLDRDGHEIPVTMVLVAHKSAGGEVERYSTISRDITERKKAEEASREAKAFIESALNSITDIFYAFDLNGKFLAWNKTFSIISGYNDQELASKKPTDFFLGEDIQRIAEAIERIYKEGSTKIDANFVTKDGSQILCEFNGSMLKDSVGNVIGFSGTGRDLTERKQLEEGLRRAESMKISTDIKSKFTSMVSHELRSPMTVIKESINLVLEELVGSVTPEQKDALETAKRNIDRLGRLINNVLDFQKIESGKTKLDIKECDLNEMVLTTSKEMNILAEEKGLSFTVNIDESIPTVKLDRDKIIQVLTNLLSNAIKFTEKGGIEVSTEREDNIVHVIIRDTGPGIQADEMPKLFQTFEQLGGGLGKKRGGTGLGLAISKEIILAHNGKIWAESQFGKGSTFHFTLPIKERRGQERG